MSSYCLHFAFLVKTGEDRLSYFSSFGQEGVVKQILYDVGGGGRFIKNLPPFFLFLFNYLINLIN